MIYPKPLSELSYADYMRLSQAYNELAESLVSSIEHLINYAYIDLKRPHTTERDLVKEAILTRLIQINPLNL